MVSYIYTTDGTWAAEFPNNTIGFQSDIFQDIPSKTYHIYITYLCIGYQCVIFTSKLLDPLVKNKDGEGYSNS